MDDTMRPLTHYESLTGLQPQLFEAACWTVVAVPRSVEQLAQATNGVVVEESSGLAELVEAQDELYLQDRADVVGMAWVIGTDRATCLLEPNGRLGATDLFQAKLERLAGGALLGSYYWNDAIGTDQLSLLTNKGFVLRSLVDRIDAEVEPAMVRLLDSVQISDDTSLRAVGLTMVELYTGVRLDANWLSSKWPIVQAPLR